MATTTGDITEITVSHPTYGNKTLQVKKGETFTYNLGGVITEDEDDGVSASGEAINKLTTTKWKLEGPIVWDMNTRDELSYMQKIAGSPLDSRFTINCINGAIHGGTGRPVGMLDGNNMGELPIKLTGGGKLKKIG